MNDFTINPCLFLPKVHKYDIILQPGKIHCRERPAYAIIFHGELNMLYNLFTQWLTLSFIFFTVQYYTEWLEVVTLGGLVTGSFISGAWMTAAARLICFLEDKRSGSAAWPWLAAAAACSYAGNFMLTALLPGYEYHPGLGDALFTAALYPAAAVYMNKFLRLKEKENGN